MNIAFDEDGWDDYTSRADNPKMLQRINRMINEASHDPGFGIGKPERLRGNLSGYWSRRIDQEHRLVYTVRGKEIVIASARHHY